MERMEEGSVVYSSGEKQVTMGDLIAQKKEEKGMKHGGGKFAARPVQKGRMSLLDAIKKAAATSVVEAEDDLTEEVRQQVAVAREDLHIVLHGIENDMKMFIPNIVKILGMGRSVDVEAQTALWHYNGKISEILNRLKGLEGLSGGEGLLEKILADEVSRTRELSLVRLGIVTTEFLSVAPEKDNLRNRWTFEAVAKMLCDRGVFGTGTRPRGLDSVFMDVRREAERLGKNWEAMERRGREEAWERLKKEEILLRKKGARGLLEALASGEDVVPRAEGYDPGDGKYHGGLFHVAIGDGKIRPLEAAGGLQGTFKKMEAIGVVISVESLSAEAFKPGTCSSQTYEGEQIPVGAVASLHRAFHSILRRAVKNARQREESVAKAVAEREPYKKEASVSADELFLDGAVGRAYVCKIGSFYLFQGREKDKKEYKNLFCLAERVEKGGSISPVKWPERFDPIFGSWEGVRDDGLPKGPAGSFFADIRNRLADVRKKATQVAADNEFARQKSEQADAEETKRREALGRAVEAEKAEASVSAPYSSDEDGERVEDLSDWEEFGEKCRGE